MGWSSKAIRKGMSAEYLAKAFFSKEGYTIYTCDTHEKSFDFIIEKDNIFERVQVKSGIYSGNLIRFRNKHGSNNSTYKITDYDILAGIWVEESKIYLFKSSEINGEGKSETITVERIDGKEMRNQSRVIPYFIGNI